jgi:predicted rRNA methylase YqxC with S4 and FtsJ domains
LRGEGAYIADFTPSPIPGRKGNREFFFLLQDTEGLSEEEFMRQVEVL